MGADYLLHRFTALDRKLGIRKVSGRSWLRDRICGWCTSHTCKQPQRFSATPIFASVTKHSSSTDYFVAGTNYTVNLVVERRARHSFPFRTAIVGLNRAFDHLDYESILAWSLNKPSELDYFYCLNLLVATFLGRLSKVVCSSSD